MLDNPAFFPVLNRCDWRGRAQCVHRPLIAGVDSLLVGFGVVTPETNLYLTTEAVAGTGKDLAAIERVALGNLSRREGRVPWKQEKTAGGAILVRTGDELTAADLLAPVGMRKAHEFFTAEQVFVAIPNRFTMIASAEPVMLAGVAAGMYDEALRDNLAPLTSDVLVFADGAPVGVARQKDRKDDRPDDTSTLDPLLAAAPLVVSLMATDQQFGDKEAAVLRTEVERELRRPRNRTVGAILALFASDPEAAGAPLQGGGNLLNVVMQLSASLHRNLSAADREAYLAFLRELALKVAGSSGGFLGFGRISKKERSTIDALFGMLDNPLLAEVMGDAAGDDEDDEKGK